MAKINFNGIDAYQKQLATLGRAASGICRYAIYDGAAIVCDAVKANTPVSTDKRTRGDLKASVSLTKMKNDNGYIYTQVIFPGYDRKGTPLDLIARRLESGSSKTKKTAFIRPAVNKVKKAVEFAIEKALNEKINQYMK